MSCKVWGARTQLFTLLLLHWKETTAEKWPDDTICWGMMSLPSLLKEPHCSDQSKHNQHQWGFSMVLGSGDAEGLSDPEHEHLPSSCCHWDLSRTEAVPVPRPSLPSSAVPAGEKRQRSTPKCTRKLTTPWLWDTTVARSWMSVLSKGEIQA